MLPTAASAGPSIVNFASGVMGQGAAAVSLNTHSDNVLFKQWTAEQLGESKFVWGLSCCLHNITTSVMLVLQRHTSRNLESQPSRYLNPSPFS